MSKTMDDEICLPSDWRWATREGDAAFARLLIRETMAPYWARRSMVFNTALFMRQWVKLKAAIIECDGAAAGVIAWDVQQGIAYLRELHLMEAYRGRGLGRRVLGDWMALQQTRGITVFRLKVFADNPAKRLYERVGFRHTKTFDDIHGLLGMQCEAG